MAKDNYPLYVILRSYGETPPKALEIIRRIEKEPLIGLGLMVRFARDVLTLFLSEDIRYDTREEYIKNHRVWITSRPLNIKVKLPLPLALRLVRRRRFRFTEVEPIRTISRGEALRILLHSDKKKS